MTNTAAYPIVFVQNQQVPAVVIGVNPLVGSATILTITVTHLLRLKHSASQLGVHTAYPLQLMLFLPFMQAGAILFQTDPLPFEKKELLSLMHEQPLQLFRSLWMWEWHALLWRVSM